MLSQTLFQAEGGAGSHSRRGTGGGGLIALQKRLRTESPIELPNKRAQRNDAAAFFRHQRGRRRVLCAPQLYSRVPQLNTTIAGVQWRQLRGHVSFTAA